jgi:hypothetical protein
MEKPMLHLLKLIHGKAFFSARVLFAFFACSLVLAHESHHQPAEQSTRRRSRSDRSWPITMPR